MCWLRSFLALVDSSRPQTTSKLRKGHHAPKCVMHRIRLRPSTRVLKYTQVPHQGSMCGQTESGRGSRYPRSCVRFEFLNEQDLNYMTVLDVDLTVLNMVEFQISLHRILCTMSCCVINHTRVYKLTELVLILKAFYR